MFLFKIFNFLKLSLPFPSLIIHKMSFFVFSGMFCQPITHCYFVEEKKRWYIGKFRGICQKADGTRVVEGTIHQLMMKTLFIYHDTSNHTEQENKS